MNTKIRTLLNLLGFPLLVGLIVAAAVLGVFPQWFDGGSAGQSFSGHQTGPVSYASAIKNAAPSVVNIFSNRLVKDQVNPYWQDLLNDPNNRQLFGLQDNPTRERFESSLGSGVVMDRQGYVLTNYHVIQQANTILVATQDGRESLAQIVGTDPESDLALLKIDLPSLQAIAKSANPVTTGDVVFAIGNPFGVGQTVSMGIVSGTGRSQLGLAEFENFIQTDAAVNPGNSGGALINALGEMVGINTAIFSRNGGFQGISFAIPIRQAERVMAQILEHGRVIRGFFGATMSEMTANQLERLGIDARQALIIGELAPEGPAQMAGLARGDIITGMGDMPIVNARMAQKQVVDSQPGDQLNIEFYRNGELNQTIVKIGVRPSPPSS